MESHDRAVRKAAFEALYKQYGAYINTIAAAFYGNVKQAMFYADARGYKSTLNMYLDGSFIPENVYKNLIKTVNDNLDKMYCYVDIRKKALGVDELHFYDIYAPMVEDIDWKISYDEAKDIVVKALAPMGEEYVSHIKEGFNNGWVDVYENTGKRSGAFSWVLMAHTHMYFLITQIHSMMFLRLFMRWDMQCTLIIPTQTSLIFMQDIRSLLRRLRQPVMKRFLCSIC